MFYNLQYYVFFNVSAEIENFIKNYIPYSTIIFYKCILILHYCIVCNN